MKTIKQLIIISIAMLAFNSSKAQTGAFFTYTLIDSCQTWGIVLLDQSNTTPNSGATYFWDFGDGSTSSLQNPTHFYNQTGPYQVLHTVTVLGTSETYLETIQFTASVGPIEFTYTTSGAGCGVPQLVSFLGFAGPNSIITQWDWHVDGQSVGNGQSLSYTFGAAGSYSVSLYAYNTSGCMSSYEEIVDVGSGGLTVGASYQILSADCIGAAVDLYSTVSGGTPPYTYQWSWYDFGASTDPSPQQVYLVTSIDEFAYLTVTDNNGCSGTASIQVPHQSGIISSFSTTPSSSCSQSCDGSISVNATGQTGPYAFTIGLGATLTGYQAVFDNLCQGAYDVTIEDANGCIEIINAFVEQDSISSILVEVDIVNGSACSLTTVCDGSVFVYPYTGVAPYLYSIDLGATFQSSGNFFNLCPETYTIITQDVNGCVGEYSFVINSPQSLGIQSSTYYASCDSNSNGQNSFINIYAFGGATPYTYIWSDGSTSSTLQNPNTGTYSVIVTDVNGCSVSETFTVPTNQCYTISGNVYVDVNGNCLFDSIDYPISCFVDLTATANGPWLWIYDYTDSNGAFSITAPAGTYYFDINGSYVSNYTVACPSSGYSVTINANNPNAVVDFFLTPPPPTQDLSINTYTAYTFTPGYPTYTTVQYCNDGTITMSGNVLVEYDAELVWYQTGITPSGYSITNNTVPSSHDAVNHILTYDFVNLQPGQCAYLSIDYETPIGTGLMPGDPILIDVTVNPIPGDVTPANNVAYLAKVITSSWDPNDKAVSPEGDITVDENDHAYYIRFQNEGNGTANTVVVKDELDANLALHSLRAIYASHDYIMTVENNNTLVFTFSNIHLVPSSFNEALSQGFVGFTLSQDGNLPVGTIIQNTAEIFFDFNPAVVTNTVENEIVEKTTGITNPYVAASLKVYPNPSTGVYQVQISNNLEATSIRVYDLIGNVIVANPNINSNQAIINLENSVAGVYFLEVTTKEGKAIQKLLKTSN